MNQMIHIFRKDMRHLWPQAALFAGLVAAFAFLDIHYSPLVDPDLILPLDPLSVVEFIMPLAAWYLIAAAILEEPLPGDREFWLTRPYGRGALLFSKALFALTTVTLPLFIADCCIFGAQGLPVLPNVGILALRQVTVAVWLVFPAFAVASITNGFGQYALAWLLVAIDVAAFIFFKTGVFLRSGGMQWMGAIWIVCLAAALLVAVAIWRQFRSRQTVSNRALLVAALLVPFVPLPWNVSLSLRRLITGTDPRTSSIVVTPESRYSIHATPSAGVERFSRDRQTACILIPLKVTGMADGWKLAAGGAQGRLVSGANNSVQQGWTPSTNLSVDGSGASHIFVCARLTDVARLANPSVTLNAHLVFGVSEDRPPIRIPAGRNAFFVEGVGSCEVTPFRGRLPLVCKSLARPPEPGDVSLQSPGHHVESRISYSTFVFAPMGLLAGFSPVYKWSTLAGAGPALQDAFDHPGPEFVFVTQKQIAWIERDVVVPGLIWPR